jgi:hypothetical protein
MGWNGMGWDGIGLDGVCRVVDTHLFVVVVMETLVLFLPAFVAYFASGRRGVYDAGFLGEERPNISGGGGTLRKSVLRIVLQYACRDFPGPRL